MLSESVANAFTYFGDPTTKETQRFVLYFDRFFDCLNVRSTNEWIRKRKPNLKPYSFPNDSRLEVSVAFTTNISESMKYVLAYCCSWLLLLLLLHVSLQYQYYYYYILVA